MHAAAAHREGGHGADAADEPACAPRVGHPRGGANVRGGEGVREAERGRAEVRLPADGGHLHAGPGAAVPGAHEVRSAAQHPRLPPTPRHGAGAVRGRAGEAEGVNDDQGDEGAGGAAVGPPGAVRRGEHAQPAQLPPRDGPPLGGGAQGAGRHHRAHHPQVRHRHLRRPQGGDAVRVCLEAGAGPGGRPPPRGGRGLRGAAEHGGAADACQPQGAHPRGALQGAARRAQAVRGGGGGAPPHHPPPRHLLRPQARQGGGGAGGGGGGEREEDVPVPPPVGAGAGGPGQPGGGAAALP
mmetsp:Transcript_15750/g.34133  ORF Transcript_15750/g.34133 Transcript_15750/m.34133 type:complete len:297 (+) Transcript_15750:933-1823(+)